MDRVYVFLIRNDIWIYILCGLGLIWYLSQYFRARQLLRGAMYGLERERGRSMYGNAVSFILFFLALSGLVAYVNLEVAPTLPPEMLRPPTMTPNPFITPFASPTPRGTDPPTLAPPTPPLVATVTLRSEVGVPPPAPGAPRPTVAGQATATRAAGPTSAPGATATTDLGGSTAGCSTAVNFTQPTDGWVVFGEVPFFGTASVDDFAAYVMEIIGPQTGNDWQSIGGSVSQPVVQGLLGQQDMTQWANGRYRVRLIVTNQAGEQFGPCVIEFDLNNS